ncbi:MAG: helicase-associated domain-containing protein [Ardenticatenaceae bacterium]|nr:helicase-associated domain-containing protein [Ardenticatenaceae bacterium]
MRSLEQALAEHELVVLRVIGEWWELDLTGAQKGECVQALAELLPQLDVVAEMEYMPPEEAAALQELVAQGGRMPVAAFRRQHGEVREMGPGRLEREEPWLEPVNVAEALYYRGFLYRGFDEIAEGLLEFYYLPDELLAQLPQPKREKKQAAVREVAPPSVAQPLVVGKKKTAVSPPKPSAVQTPPAAPKQPAPAAKPDTTLPEAASAVDDLTTMLAFAQRTGFAAETRHQLDRLLLDNDPARRSLLLTLAREMELLRQVDGGVRPTRTAVSWLQSSREQQTDALADAWSHSSWNDLHHVPGLICEGERWQNDPLLPRTTLIDYLPRELGWFKVGELTAVIKTNDPDFQRPDGNYDTWYVREAESNQFLSGFGSWDKVEGRLLAFLLRGPLRWLGLTDFGQDEVGEPIYQVTPTLLNWLNQQPAKADEVTVPIVVEQQAVILVPFNANRYQRFQVSRVADALPVEPGKPFAYRITPQSLVAAKEQGIDADRLLQFLETTSGRPVPAGVKRAISRWGERGVEGRLEQVVILRVREAAILDILRNNAQTQGFIGESLGDFAAVVRQQDWQPLLETTARLGLLLDIAMG